MASKLLKNGTVITFDEPTLSIKVLPRACILISDGKIQAITEDFNSLSLPEEVEVIDVSGKIVAPGFVNTHVHSWLTAFRSIAPNVTLAHYFGWLSQASSAATQGFTPDDVFVSALEGYAEAVNGGVTSCLEHAHSHWNADVAQAAYDAAMDSGMRVWWCYDVGGRDKSSQEEQWKTLEEICHQHPAGDEMVKLGIAYDNLAGALPDELEHTKAMIKELKLEAITMHHLGGPWPGGSDAPTAPSQLCRHGLHTADIPIVVSHAGYLTDQDQHAMRSHNVHISITPESEFHYGHGQTTGHLVSDKASLGTDTACTFSGDILTQARLWLQYARDKLYQQTLESGKLPNATPMTVEQGFLLATRQGGLALHRQDIGVLKVGAQADIVVFDGESPNMLGWSDAVAAIMLHANVGDIEHVLVGGEFRKRDFRLANAKMDWAELKQRFLATAKRVQQFASSPPPVPERLWDVGETGDVPNVSTIVK